VSPTRGLNTDSGGRKKKEKCCHVGTFAWAIRRRIPEEIEGKGKGLLHVFSTTLREEKRGGTTWNIEGGKGGTVRSSIGERPPVREMEDPLSPEIGYNFHRQTGEKRRLSLLAFFLS